MVISLVCSCLGTTPIEAWHGDGAPTLMAIQRGFEKRVSPKLRDYFVGTFSREYCDAQHVNEVCSLDNSVLKRFSRIDEDFLLERLAVNRRIITCVRRKEFSTGILSGFYLVYPLTEDCQELIEAGLIIGSRQITADHITLTFDEASAIYVSMVYGRDRLTRAFVVYSLGQTLSEVITKRKADSTIYTGPNSPEGFHLAERYGFTRMSTNAEILRCRVGARQAIA